ncbi:hypothetical protein RZR97_04305 [Hydrogenimonas thermophila]|uniref:hypothetical protein n=1 Tax=Hydrogenimonas thermophila TaxID=223786 RepID=UPI002936E41B|nr:hypothetical protein [Hydrogenimonas thermophila]WOE70800.1 hypothetical protein RZR91_04325 [Hydrogenimonas thermophila]WOE73318.1 hypothetical protein RZR97_04305 [Hydrogenimonas thermophila]
MIYFSSSKSMTYKELEIKNRFVHQVGLPDLSLATEARFIRFRSLTDIYSPFNEGPEILDYFPASFTYYPALKGKNSIPSKVIIK